MAQVLHTSGDNTKLHPPFTPIKLQQAVGGMIEYVTIPNKQLLIVKEQRLVYRHDTNLVATLICGYQIVGNVVLLSPSETKEYCDE